MGITMYSLLHIQEGEFSAINVLTKDIRDQTELYVDNAITLGRSLQMYNLPFVLLTNRKQVVEEILVSRKEHLLVKEIPFVTQVPSGTRLLFGTFQAGCFPISLSLP